MNSRRSEIRQSLLRLLHVAVLFMLPAVMYGQNPVNNHVLIQQNVPWNWNIDSDMDMQTANVLPNALSVKVRTQANKCTILVRYTSFSGPVGFNQGVLPIHLQFVSTTSSGSFNVAQTLQPLNVNQVLFQQNTAASQQTYQYNVILGPLGYSGYPVGTYNFTLTFTMTQP